MNILIAEDDEFSARVLSRNMEKLGHTVMLAPNGKEAWRIFQEGRVNVLLTDWQMPEMDGLELCRKVRSLGKRTDYTYIIMLTAAFTGQENYLQAMDAGADDFLIKSYDREELLVRMRVAERIIRFHTEIQELKELLPICGYCKSIRDRQDKAYWHKIETYLHSHLGKDLTHGICPECYQKVQTEFETTLLRRKKETEG